MKKLSLNSLVWISIFTLLFFTSIVYISADGDIYWQLLHGKIILTQNRLPSETDFTWLSHSYLTKLLDHEWLSEVCIYLFSLVPYGLYLLKGLLLLLLFVVCYNLYSRKEVTFWDLVLISLVFCVMQYFLQLKPYVIAMIFFGIEVLILSRRYKNKLSLLFLPLLSILWVNLHGGDSVVFLIVGLIYYFSKKWNFSIGKIESRAYPSRVWKKDVKFLLFSYALQIFNPYGWRAFLYPFENMSDSVMKKLITEWFPTNINTSKGLIIMLLIIVVFLIMFCQSLRPVMLEDLLLFGAFTCLTLSSERNAMFLCVLSFYLIPKYFYYDVELSAKNKKIVIAVCCVLSFMLIASFGSRHNSIKATNSSNLKAECIKEVVDSEPLRLFNSYDYGSLLEYNGVHVFIDSRYVPYKLITKDYTYFENCTLYVEDLMREFDFDYLLVDKNSSIYGYICRNSSDFKLLYTDDKVSYFRRLKYE